MTELNNQQLQEVNGGEPVAIILFCVGVYLGWQEAHGE